MTVARDVPAMAARSLCVIFCNGDVPLCNVDYNNTYPTDGKTVIQYRERPPTDDEFSSDAW